MRVSMEVLEGWGSLLGLDRWQLWHLPRVQNTDRQCLQDPLDLCLISKMREEEREREQERVRERINMNMNERIVHSSQLLSSWPSIGGTSQVTALSRVLLLRTPLPSFCGPVCFLQAARTHWLHCPHVTLAAGSVEVACRIFEFLGN